MSDRVTTTCTCWRLTRRDGRIQGFTDHDRTLAFAGTSFEPQSGFTQSEAQSSLGLAMDAAEIEGALSSDALAPADIDAGLLDGAKVETFDVNWQKPHEARLLRVAAIGRIVRRDGALVAELESPTRNLDRPAGRRLRRSCDAELGDGRCRARLDGPGMSAASTVMRTIGTDGLVVSGIENHADGWFASGSVRVAGRILHIATHRRGTEGIVLRLTEPAALAVGTHLELRTGCDKSFATCRTKFDNGLNFRGFPHLPGNDAAYAYVSEDAVFDGGVLVP